MNQSEFFYSSFSFLARILHFYHCRKGHIGDSYLFLSFDTIVFGQGPGHIFLWRKIIFQEKSWQYLETSGLLKRSMSEEARQGRQTQGGSTWQRTGNEKVVEAFGFCTLGRRHLPTSLDKRLPMPSRKVTGKGCFCLFEVFRTKNSKDFLNVVCERQELYSDIILAKDRIPFPGQWADRLGSHFTNGQGSELCVP